jgi:hypothetical protein
VTNLLGTEEAEWAEVGVTVAFLVAPGPSVRHLLSRDKAPPLPEVAPLASVVSTLCLARLPRRAKTPAASSGAALNHAMTPTIVSSSNGPTRLLKAVVTSAAVATESLRAMMAEEAVAMAITLGGASQATEASVGEDRLSTMNLPLLLPLHLQYEAGEVRVEEKLRGVAHSTVAEVEARERQKKALAWS